MNKKTNDYMREIKLNEGIVCLTETIAKHEEELIKSLNDKQYNLFNKYKCAIDKKIEFLMTEFYNF